MNILAIGSDRSVCNPVNGSAERQRAYGNHFDTLSILVFSHQSHRISPIALSKSVQVYPTNSRWKWCYGIDAMRIAHRILKVDVVTAQDPFEAGLVAWVIARIKRAAFHVQIHTDPFAPEFAHSRLNRLRLPVMRFILKRADRIRVVSKRIQEGIVRDNLSHAPVSVLPIFVDVLAYAKAEREERALVFAHFERIFLVVSRLEWEKNVALAISAFADAAGENDCLIIVGAGSARAHLEKFAAAKNVSARVFFEGEAQPESYFALADLVLVPSRYEGYGLVIAEALAAGKPVLATDVGAARELGAMVTTGAHFTEALKKWIVDGPFVGTLQNYPYGSFEMYVRAYCDDISNTKR